MLDIARAFLLASAFMGVSPAFAKPDTFATDILQVRRGAGTPITVSVMEIPLRAEGPFVKELLAYVKRNPREYPLIVFYTSQDVEIAAQLKNLEPALAARLAGVQIDLPTTARHVHARSRSVAGEFSLAQVKRAGQFVSVASIALSGISFYFSSNAGSLPTMLNLGLSTTLTLLFAGQVKFLNNFPAMFSRAINESGKALQPVLSTVIRADSDKMKMLKYNLGRTLALAPPSLLITSLFFLAANSGDVTKAFGSWSAWGSILAQMGPGLMVNTAWDLFEADIRERNDYADEDEKLARLSGYTRSLIGAVIGGLFYLPHYGIALNTSLTMTHAAVGVAAYWYAGKSVPLLEKVMGGLQNSRSLNSVVTGYANFVSRRKGSDKKFVSGPETLLPLPSPKDVTCSNALTGS